MLFDKMDIDIWEVIERQRRSPSDSRRFIRPGLGGHCIPIDPFYLTWKARNMIFQNVLSSSPVNKHEHAVLCCAKDDRCLSVQGKSLNRAKILILGVAYKKDIDDQRESLLCALYSCQGKERQRGIQRSARAFCQDTALSWHRYASVKLTAAALKKADVVITPYWSFKLRL